MSAVSHVHLCSAHVLLCVCVCVCVCDQATGICQAPGHPNLFRPPVGGQLPHAKPRVWLATLTRKADMLALSILCAGWEAEQHRKPAEQQ